MKSLMDSSATLPLVCLVSPKLLRPILQQRTFNDADGNILSASLPPKLSSNDFGRLRMTRQSSEGRTKKLSLGLHRGRPPIGSRGRTSDSLLERKASVQKVESSFARINQQLAQSAEEYQALQDRLEKLNEEINKLRTLLHKTKFAELGKSWQVAPAVHVHQRRGVQLVSGPRGNHLLPTWEGTGGGEKKKLINSCAESRESTSEYYAGTHVSQGACEFVVKCQQEHSPLSSEAEDDVFN